MKIQLNYPYALKLKHWTWWFTTSELLYYESYSPNHIHRIKPQYPKLAIQVFLRFTWLCNLFLLVWISQSPTLLKSLQEVEWLPLSRNQIAPRRSGFDLHNKNQLLNSKIENQNLALFNISRSNRNQFIQTFLKRWNSSGIYNASWTRVSGTPQFSKHHSSIPSGYYLLIPNILNFFILSRWTLNFFIEISDHWEAQNAISRINLHCFNSKICEKIWNFLNLVATSVLKSEYMYD